MAMIAIPREQVGTEGVVDLTQWFERMETVFRISNCTVENQVKFATCTLMGIALTWWNSHVRTMTNDVAYAMTMFPEETDKIERYVGGMPDLIYSSVVASKPKTMQEAIEMATELMDRRINTFAERQAENKRRFEDTPRNNQNQQQNKRQNTGKAYAAGNGDKKPYEGTKPLCPKWLYAWELQGKTINIIRAPRPEVSAKDVTFFLAQITSKEMEDKFQRRCNARCFIRHSSLPWESFELYSSRRRWIVTDVHRIIGNKQTIGEETVIATRIDDLFDQLRGRASLRDRTKGQVITPKEGFEKKHLEDCLQNSIMDIMNSSYAVWRLTNAPAVTHEEHEDIIGVVEVRAKFVSLKIGHLLSQHGDSSFLGLAGYYRRFIEGFSKIAKPMTKLTQKKVKFGWGDKQEAAFQLLKQKLCSATHLALPKEVFTDHKREGIMSLDALSRKDREDTIKGSSLSHDYRFASNFLELLQKAFGYKFSYLSVANHRKLTESDENHNNLSDVMLRACVIDFGNGWVKHLPLVEFSYNNSYHASIKAAPFEALYGRKCRSPVCWAEMEFEVIKKRVGDVLTSSTSCRAELEFIIHFSVPTLKEVSCDETLSPFVGWDFILLTSSVCQKETIEIIDVKLRLKEAYPIIQGSMELQERS
ncbi:putative reverse transcriptase domain-containing protein [Tanacetum coccineum]